MQPSFALEHARIILPLAVAMAVALAVVGGSQPRLGVAQAPTATVTPSPTLEAWQPQGRWGAQHARATSPLFPGSRPPNLNAIHGVVLPDGGVEAWAVGDACSVAVYRDGAWQRVTDFEAQCGRREFDLRDVFVLGPDDLWAVGRYTGGSGLERVCVAEEPADRHDVGYEEGCGFVARWDGTTWRVMMGNELGVLRPAPPLNALDLRYDPEVGQLVGWAVGNDADYDSLKAIILQYVAEDGGSWDHTNVARSTNITVDLRAVKVHSAGEAWAVGEDGHEAWYYAPDGQSGDWGARGKSGRDHLYAMDMTDPLYGWDGGWRGRMNNYIGFCHDDDPETACWFDNEGQPLRIPPSSSVQTFDVLGIDLLRRGVGWTVGSSGPSRSTVAFLQPDRHWYLVEVEDDPAVDLHDVWLVDDVRGWAVGEEGTILEYRTLEPATATATPTTTATSPATPTSRATSTSEATATEASTTAPSPTTEPTASQLTATPTAGPPTGGTPTAPSPSATTGPGSTPRIFLPFAWRPRPAIPSQTAR